MDPRFSYSQRFVEMHKDFLQCASDGEFYVLDELIHQAGRTAWAAARTGILTEDLAQATFLAEDMYDEIRRGEYPQLSYTLKRTASTIKIKFNAELDIPALDLSNPDFVPRTAYIRCARQLFWELKVIPHLYSINLDIRLREYTKVNAKLGVAKFHPTINCDEYSQWPFHILADFDANTVEDLSRSLAFSPLDKARIHAAACELMAELLSPSPMELGRVRLKPIEIKILKQCKENAPITAETIAEEIEKEPDSAFREALSTLTRFGFLQNLRPGGYILTRLGSYYRNASTPDSLPH